MLNKGYYIVATVIIIVTLIPFFLSFEGRKPKAREVVTLGVLVGIAVASRVAFIWVPHFKPMAAIVIICGIAFGIESGFLCGALSALISNFIFGQGYWTPWQMVAFGVAGALAGLLFNKNIVKANRITITVYGVVVMLLITGPILDTSSVFMMLSNITVKGAFAVYMAGLPVNLIQTIATGLTLVFVGMPLLNKIQRVKIKYGLMEKENEL